MQNEDGQIGIDDWSKNINSPKVQDMTPMSRPSPPPDPPGIMDKVVDSMLGVRYTGRTFARLPIVAGSRNTLAIDSDGGVWSWGWNERGTLGHGHRGKELKPKRIAALQGVCMRQVAVNGWHCLGLADTGQVFAWGGNEYLQCGNEPSKRDILTPIICLPQV